MRTDEVVVCDIEVYANFFLVKIKRLRDGKIIRFELSDRSSIDLTRLRAVLMSHTVVTYNGQGFDIPLIFLALEGASNARLMQATTQIIEGGLRWWEVERAFGITIPARLDHIDLIEPQPNAFASLKTLAGRLHRRKMQDLPYEPGSTLTHEQMDEVDRYCDNDLDSTEDLWNALAGPMELRLALGAEYGQDFRSKSDSQIGEAIVKKRVEQIIGRRVEKAKVEPGRIFRYRVPPYMAFQTPELQAALSRIAETDFVVKKDGKVDLPKWLSEIEVTFGDTTYAMGIGGLHSTETNRTVYADDEHLLIDHDVASYYPAIILGSGLFPKALGPTFLDVYRKIRDERLEAKHKGNKVAAEGLKIALNGCFGKLGSQYSILYAPDLMVAVTLTGQLALLMLIERAELYGIPVVSGNTDGVVFRCPAHLRDALTRITQQWERDTGFELEATPYRAIHNLSVNTYYAIKEDGKAKRKGTLSNPWADESDIRGQLMKNPNMTICSDAALAYIQHGTPIEDTIRGSTDIRGFVTVVNVAGGGTWRGEYLGKVVRYIWARDGDPISYKNPDPRTGNHKKVSKSDGAMPMMDLPEEFPAGLLDYDRYIAEANEILVDVGYRPPPPPPIKLRRGAALPALMGFALAA